MKININKKDLSSLAALVSRAASTKNTIPVLSGLLIQAISDKGLVMTATDMEIGIKASTPNVEIIEEGSVLVNAHYFTNFIKLLPDGLISIELDRDKSKLNIKYGRSSVSLNIYGEQEYVDLPIDKMEYKFSLPQKNIREGLRKTSFAAAYTHFRQVFTGILFDIVDKKKLKIVASDTHRLACYIYNINMSEKKDLVPVNFIIPLRTANELLRLLEESEEEIKIAFNDNNVIFYRDDFIFLSRLIDGNYPNYENVVPDSFTTAVKIKKTMLANALERIKVMPTDDKMRIQQARFVFQEKEAVISAYSDMMGEIEEIIEMQQIEGESDFKISFNVNYFLDIVKIIEDECDEIVIRMSDPLKPVDIRKPEDENYFYILVPLRTGIEKEE